MGLVIANSYPTRAHGIIVNYDHCSFCLSLKNILKKFYKLEMVLKLGSSQDSKVINKTCNNFLGFG